MKKITIIIPCFNSQNFISTALQSVWNQNINPEIYDVIIIDDGSIDETESVIKGWIKTNEAKNFKYIKKENGNWGGVINYVKANKLIKSDYVTVLDADDYYLEGCFESILHHLSGKYDLVITNYLQNKNNKMQKVKVINNFETSEIEPTIAHTVYSTSLCKFYKSEIFKKMPDLKENVPFQDQVLYHLFLLESKRVFFINKFLGVYWYERGGTSSTLKWTNLKVKTWTYNMNLLLSTGSKELAAYVLMMIWYSKKRISFKFRKEFKINPKNKAILKQANFCWLPKIKRKSVKLLLLIGTYTIRKR